MNAPRNMGVETGGCPHTAIRENASMNLAAIEDMNHSGLVLSRSALGLENDVRWRDLWSADESV